MTLSIPPTGQPNKKALSPWEQDIQAMELRAEGAESEEEEYISEGEIKRPTYRNPIINFALIGSATVGIALLLGYMFFPSFMGGGEQAAPVTKKTANDSTLDNTDQQRAAENQAKLAMGGSEKAFSSHNTQVTPSPTSSPMVSASVPNAVSKPKPSVSSPPVAQVKAPTVIYKQAPVAQVKPSPASFIQLGAQQQQQQQHRQPKEFRQPLPSEATLFTPRQKSQPKPQPQAQPVNTTPVITGPTLVAGGTASAYLMSNLQFPQQARSPIEMRVKINTQLTASSGYALPAGTVLLFAVTCDPSNNAISAISGDAMYQGRRIKMEPGAISINNMNGEPLVAEAYRPGMGDLANADRNNAVLSGLASAGENMSNTDSTVVTTGGSTVITQKTNQSLLGSFARGAFGQWSKAQGSRTEEESRKILSASPIQVLKQKTRMMVTVTAPSTISY